MARRVLTICFYLATALATTIDAFSVHPSGTIARAAGSRRGEGVAAVCSNDIFPQRQRRSPPSAVLYSSTGTLYSADDDDAPMVWLFTKEGCPKTAPVVELLSSLRADYPHDLEAVDICDDENRATWFSMYQDDLPVLHMDDDYWAKNGDVTESDARSAFEEFRSGNFKARTGEPDAEGGDGMEAAMHVGRA